MGQPVLGSVPIRTRLKLIVLAAQSNSLPKYMFGEKPCVLALTY
jgi:hypothetical protein